jgi:hypothetical protein
VFVNENKNLAQIGGPLWWQPGELTPIASRKKVLEMRFVASNKKVLEMVCEK